MQRPSLVVSKGQYLQCWTFGCLMVDGCLAERKRGGTGVEERWEDDVWQGFVAAEGNVGVNITFACRLGWQVWWWIQEVVLRARGFDGSKDSHSSSTSQLFSRYFCIYHAPFDDNSCATSSTSSSHLQSHLPKRGATPEPSLTLSKNSQHGPSWWSCRWVLWPDCEGEEGEQEGEVVGRWALGRAWNVTWLFGQTYSPSLWTRITSLIGGLSSPII